MKRKDDKKTLSKTGDDTNKKQKSDVNDKTDALSHEVETFFDMTLNNIPKQSGGASTYNFIRLPVCDPLNVSTSVVTHKNDKTRKVLDGYDGENYCRLWRYHAAITCKAVADPTIKTALRRLNHLSLFVTETQCRSLFKHLSEKDIRDCLKDKHHTYTRKTFFKKGNPNANDHQNKRDQYIPCGTTPLYHLAEIVGDLEKERPDRFQHLSGGRSEVLDAKLKTIAELRTRDEVLPKWIERADKLLRLDVVSETEAKALTHTAEDLDAVVVRSDSNVNCLQSLCLRAIHRAGAVGELALDKHLKNPKINIPDEIKQAIWPHVGISKDDMDHIKNDYFVRYGFLTTTRANTIVSAIEENKTQYESFSEYMNAILHELIRETMSSWEFLEEVPCTLAYLEENVWPFEEGSKKRKNVEDKIEQSRMERNALLALYLKTRIASHIRNSSSKPSKGDAFVQPIYFSIAILDSVEIDALKRYETTSKSKKVRTQKRLAKQLHDISTLPLSVALIPAYRMKLSKLLGI